MRKIRVRETGFKSVPVEKDPKSGGAPITTRVISELTSRATVESRVIIAVLEFFCVMQVSSSTPGMALATKSNLVEDIIPDVLLCAIIFENCYKAILKSF